MVCCIWIFGCITRRPLWARTGRCQAANSGHPSVCIKGQVKTDCRHRPIRNARSIAVIHISILTVSNVASISIDRGTVPGHLQNYRRKPPPLSICTTRNAHIRPHRACKTGPRRKWAKKKAIIPARERWPGGFKIIGTPLRDKLLQLREEQSHAKSPAWACFHVDS